jgi:GntR family transcriptional regulator, transcriptional repressor for pyruvate dehydrogenase complex
MTPDNLFVPVQTGRAGEDIALQIQAAILEGRIKPGEKLPSERDLQTFYKTGRGVIREAFQVLKHKGLIEIHKGAKGGAYVKHLEVVFASESFALFLRQNRTDPMHLIEFRESIDHMITDLAIARGSSEEKRNLSEKADQLAAAVNDGTAGLEKLIELDRELNILFSKMARNPIFEWIMQAVQIGFSSMDNALYEDAEYRAYAVENWQETAMWILASDPVRTKSCIGYHYRILRQKVKEIRSASGTNIFADGSANR